MNRRHPVPYLSLLFVVAVSLFLYSCGRSGSTGTQHSGVVIVPKPAEGMVFGSSISDAEAKSRPPEEMPAVKVPLTPDILVQQVINTNLDIDDMDEQIVVFKRREPARGEVARSTRQNGESPTTAGRPAQQVTGNGTPVTTTAGTDGAGSPIIGAPAQPAPQPNTVGDNGASSGAIRSETVQGVEARTSNDAIWIMVVDFDTVRNTYVIAWEAPTLATNIRTFKVFTRDLLGDHNLEIICEGFDANGEQTIDVFKRLSGGVGLKYESILSLTSDGSVDIQEQDRSDAYHSGQALGKSFPVITLTRDTQSANPLDMTRTTYFYRSQDGKYVKGFTEKIPGNRIEEAQLSKLYNGSADNFEDFLNGPWYRANNGAPSDANTPTAESTDIMFYNRRARTITFAHGEVEQSFTIETAYKTAFQRGIQLHVRNDAIPTLRHWAAISVPSLDTIAVVITGDDSWNGTYRRLTGGLHQAIFGDQQKGVSLSELKLSGLYKDDSGAELFFSPPRFTLRENGTEQTGEFIIYQHQQKVLELRMISETGRVGQRRLYIMDYSEEKSKSQIVRVLKLTPATVSVHGFEPLNTNIQRFEQIERVRQSSTGTAAAQ